MIKLPKLDKRVRFVKLVKLDKMVKLVELAKLVKKSVKLVKLAKLVELHSFCHIRFLKTDVTKAFSFIIISFMSVISIIRQWEAIWRLLIVKLKILTLSHLVHLTDYK